MLKQVLKRLTGARRAQAAVDYQGLGPVATTVLREQHTFLSPGVMRNLEATMKEVADRGVIGDIAEFGLGPGGSAVVLAQFASKDQPYHGFDVFSMIPPPSSDKDDRMSRDRYKVIAAGKAADHGKNQYYGYRADLIGDIRRLLARFGTPEDGKTVSLHKGLFQDTLPDYHPQAISFAHVDCDWYDPVKLCLEFVAPRLAPGGVIVVDDYPEFGGCKAATDEFLAANAAEFTATMKTRLVIQRR